jgi:hypothetical protein
MRTPVMAAKRIGRAGNEGSYEERKTNKVRDSGYLLGRRPRQRVFVTSAFDTLEYRKK